MGLFSDGNLLEFQEKLITWYDLHRRELPWRSTRNAYQIWLSEIMLQQTRVAAVIEHYQEFLKRFPSIEILAAARESSVLAAWSGLGYYRRARMLHAAAKVIVREHKGAFPKSAQELLALPGIGRYTAAAIASIAFEQPVAVVDGNVERVLQRVVGRPLSGEVLWKVAALLLDKSRPGDFNQAMMELGATVCTPRVPTCLTCPVNGLCATRGELGILRKKAPQQRREIHYALHHRDKNGKGSEILLVRRPRAASLMPGMWELPARQGEDLGDIPMFELRHSITTTDYRVKVWRRTAPPNVRGEWIPFARVQRLPLTGLARKIWRTAKLSN